MPLKPKSLDLKKPEALSSKILKMLPMPVIVIDGNDCIVQVNAGAEKLFTGLYDKLSEPYSLDDLIDQESLKKIKQKLNCLRKSGKGIKTEIRVQQQKKDQHAIFVLEFQLIEPDSEFVLISATDISTTVELHEQIGSLRKSFEPFFPKKVEENILFKRLNEAVMQSANTIVITDLKGNIVFANPKFEETTGYSFKEAYLKNPRILKSGDQPRSYYKELWGTISSGKVWKGEFKNRKKSGEYYWESATITPIKDSLGNVMEYLAIKEDITERKRIEERLEKTLMEMEVSNWEYKRLNEDLKQEVERRKTVESELQLQKELLQELNESLESQVQVEVKKNREKDELLLLQCRQAAMGEMIGNIAHQWRQPLNTISLMVYDLTDAFRFGEIDREYVDKSEADIKSVIEHMSQTIDDFRNFFKPNKEKQYFSLAEVVKTSVSFLDASLRNSGIKVITEVDPEITLFGYSSEFAQVLLNLINNSKDAIADQQIEKPVIRISSHIKSGKAETRVIDNAGGIPQEIMHKIFDPYFTTKEQGKGTGVGLYMSKTIIERNMGGDIEARNTRTGAEFLIKIPTADKE